MKVYFLWIRVSYNVSRSNFYVISAGDLYLCMMVCGFCCQLVRKPPVLSNKFFDTMLENRK